MHGRIRRLAAALAVLALLGSAAPVAAEMGASDRLQVGDKTPPMADLLVLRPMGFVALGVGAGLFAAFGPLTLLIRPTEIGTPFKTLIAAPVRFTFVDPLGSH